MTKPQAEHLMHCSTTHRPPAAVIWCPKPWLCLVLCERGTGTKKGVKNHILPCTPQALAVPPSLHMCQPTCLPMHKNQHRPIFRIKFLLQLHMPAQAHALPSCPPDLAATTSGIPQLNPPANNPRLHLSNHSMDILTASVLITKQGYGPFPTVETNWDSVAIPLLQLSTL